ncbi:MAG: ATP-binding cassette domain-containing protein [Desulfobacterales bacterium]|nr:ATP-binding cassette domain-containing protein [Desulfobacterales bacterium]
MIRVENLTKYFNEFCAVNQISLEIRKGEILGLLGPNGAGKTTTLRMLTGFLRPTSGTIRIQDRTIHEDPLRTKKLMGYLPESAPLYHEMIVYDYLTFVANIRGMDKKQIPARIRHMAGTCGLHGVMHQPIGELSKGFKQRVGLAHAMIDDPEILILDEPTSGLDPNQIIEIREIIRQIGKEKTIILSTHILSEAEATCDRVVIISQGKIVADGSMENLKQSAGGKCLIYISLQNADFNAVEKQLGGLLGVENISVEDRDAGRLQVRLTCSSAVDLRADLYRKIKETDWILLEFMQQSQSLENIFRELTKDS